jgi:two-component system, NtrC family, response regulator HydG
MMKNNQFFILVVDDELEHREVLEMILTSKGYAVKTCESGKAALKLLEKGSYDVVLTDFIMPEMDGIELLRQIKRKHKGVEVIVITGYGSIENAVDAIKEGAFTYIIKGNDPEEMLLEIEKIKKIKLLEQDNEILKGLIKNVDFMLSSNNVRFQNVIRTIQKAAKSDVNMLILGESGVGKEVLSLYIHQCSDRKENHFVAVNCHEFSDNLLESELFGHEKGSFTGAYTRRIGKFEEAHGGTFFLDEVGDIPMSTQAKLLRILEAKKVERVGSNQLISVDFRLIAATNKNLAEEISKGNFREDLFYRLSTIVVEIPPLRERKEDLPMFIEFFMEKAKREQKKEIHTIEKTVMDFLLDYEYPGNIRELKNIIERLVVLSEDGLVRDIDLPIINRKNNYFEDNSRVRSLNEVRKDVEARYIEKILEMCDYNMTRTAEKLMISRRQLFNKVNEYGIK